jgi:hypothetical protein
MVESAALDIPVTNLHFPRNEAHVTSRCHYLLFMIVDESAAYVRTRYSSCPTGDQIRHLIAIIKFVAIHLLKMLDYSLFMYFSTPSIRTEMQHIRIGMNQQDVQQ